MGASLLALAKSIYYDIKTSQEVFSTSYFYLQLS